MPKHFTIAKIEGGKIANPKSVKTLFESLKDGRWLVEITNANKRTLPQNAYLHAVLIPEFRKALNSVGYDMVKYDSQAKQIMKKTFLTRQVVNEQTGEVLEYVQDTHDLTTIEMNILIDEVIKFTAENMNYQIPYPNEQTLINY